MPSLEATCSPEEPDDEPNGPETGESALRGSHRRDGDTDGAVGNPGRPHSCAFRGGKCPRCGTRGLPVN